MPPRTRRPRVSPARTRTPGFNDPEDGGALVLGTDFSATQENLLCVICLDVMVEPVTLSCGHSVCRHCLVAHMESISDAMVAATGSAVCPVARCLVAFVVPATSVSLKAAIESRHAENIAARRAANDIPLAGNVARRVSSLRARGLRFPEFTSHERALVAAARAGEQLHLYVLLPLRIMQLATCLATLLRQQRRVASST